MAVTLHGGVEGDTATIEKTLDAADENLKKARATGDKSKTRASAEEAVGDKGYHSKRVMMNLALAGRRSYISEPTRGRQDWEGEALERDAVYANRRRKKGLRGQRLMRRRGEMLERSFAHVLETGGMRRTHLRFHYNIVKRMLIHVAGFNLGLLMRKRFGAGTPRGLQGRTVAAITAFAALIDLISDLIGVPGYRHPEDQPESIESTWLMPELLAAEPQRLSPRAARPEARRFGIAASSAQGRGCALRVAEGASSRRRSLTSVSSALMRCCWACSAAASIVA